MLCEHNHFCNCNGDCMKQPPTLDELIKQAQQAIEEDTGIKDYTP